VISNKLGLKWPESTPEWKKNLVRKVNFLSLIGALNVIAAFIVFQIIGFQFLNFHLFVVLGLAAAIFLLNYKGKFILASYLFFAIGIYLLGMATIYMQLESNVLMYFFPLTFSIVQIYGRRESFVHLIIWCTIYFLAIAFLVIFGPNYYPIKIPDTTMDALKVFNGIFAFFCGLMQITVITWLNIRQEEQIRNVIDEKRLLLAELYHRVKNNLNIVTSLINIKKNNSDSQEVVDALEDCRGRVYSMALVHQQMYSGSKVGNLNMMNYMVELIRNVEHAFGGDADVILEVDSGELILPISKAVPIGLIMNELITNAYKHATIPDKKLIVKIHVSQIGNSLQIEVTDNGPGIKAGKEENPSKLGFELIRSLCEQIDASFIIGKKTAEGPGTNIQIKIIDYTEKAQLFV
jgi:two-component sensor histidine kinase